MVDISNKIDKIEAMIEEEEYFTINKARQYGKTTTLDSLYERLKDKYLVIYCNFEGMGLTSDDIDKNIANNAEFGELIKDILINGIEPSYVLGNETYRLGEMFALLAHKDGKVVISNRIFETYLYEKFISKNKTSDRFYNITKNLEKERFVKDEDLNMELILKKFQEHFTQYYKDEFDEK